jgi:ribosomal protein S18 acetylase RimI-like enzyme
MSAVRFTAADVYKLDETHTDAASALLTRAFFDYPMWSWVMPDQAHRTSALPIAMRASVVWGLLLGAVYGVGRPLRGMAIWAPPGMADADVDPDGSKLDWDNVVAAIGPEGMQRFESMIEVQKPLPGQHMDARTWYLPWLGVDPDAQRTGAGSALLRAMWARLDAEGAASYLETEKVANVPYYLKQGYEVVEQGVLPEGGPEYSCFLRRPRLGRTALDVQSHAECHVTV